MSTTIDERIVSMQFDNKNFEKHAAESMSTLDKLKAKLNLKGAADGLSELDKAAKNCDVGVVGESAEKVGLKFNAMFTIADQALRNITNSAMAAGQQLIKSLTIDPIKTGLSEYETQLNAIQTILANTESKGSTLEDVNKALDELNTYADKTIYNFTEMTRNIGTFTAAGVDLDTSVAAIKGIANLAAVSGSTSQQASTAMYQLSQALSSGTVRLMDWNSVVNAGMGGQVFQDALKETARVHGIAIDDIIKKQGSFRESLSEGWLTSEILTDTLAKFTGDLSKEQILSMGYTEAQAESILKLGETANDAATKVKTFTQLMETLKESAQSGWAQTWKLLIGDFNEAKSIWSMASEELGAIIGGAAEKRNKMLSETLVPALDSGWDNFLKAGVMDETGFGNHLKGILGDKANLDELIKKYGTLGTAIQEGLKSGVISSDDLALATKRLSDEYGLMSDKQLENKGITKDQVEALKELNEGIQNGSISMDEFSDKIKRMSGRELIIQSVVNVIKALNSVIQPIKDAWSEIFPPATADTIYGILESIHNFTAGLILTGKKAENLKRTFKGLFAVFDIAFTILKTVGSAILQVLGHFSGLGGGILEVTGTLGDFLVKIRDAVKKSTGLQTFANNVAAAVGVIVTSIKNMALGLKEKIDTSGLSKFVSFLQGVWEVIKTIFGHIVSVLGGIGGAISDTITGSGITGLLEIFNTGVLGAILLGIKKLFDNLDGIVDGFTGIMDSITGALKAFQQQVRAEVLESISSSMIMLAIAVLIISLIDKDKLERSLAAITIMFAGLMAALSMAGRIDAVAISTSTVIGIALSLLILSSALVKLSEIPTSDLTGGVFALVGALAALVGALQVLARIEVTDTNMAIGGAKQIFLLGLALLPIVYILKQLSNVYWTDLAISVGAMMVALGSLVGALKLLSKITVKEGSMAIGGAKQLLLISLALLPLALAVKMIGSMDWDSIAKAGVVIGVGLLALITALGVVALLDKAAAGLAKSDTGPTFKAVVGKCAQITLIAVSLGLLAVSLAIISAISWEGIIKGLTTMVVALAILLKGLEKIGKIEINHLAKSVASMIVMSVSIATLAGTLAILGQMEWGTIAKGLTAMAGTMAVLTIALKAISKVSTSKTGALANIFSGDMLKLKQDVSLIRGAAALLILASAIRVLASSLLILGQMKLGTIVKGLIAIAGTVAILGVSATLLNTASLGMIKIAGAVALLGLSCLAAGAGVALMATGLNLLGESIGNAIVSICTVIIDSADYIAKALITLLTSVLDGLVQSTDRIVESLLQIILNSIQSLSKYLPDIAAALMELLIGVVDELINYIPEIVGLVTKLLNALFDAVGDVFSQLDTDSLLKGSAAIAILGGMMVALSKIGIKMIPKALLGVVGITAVVVALGTIFGLLSKIPGLSDLIGNGGGILAALGSAIGMFIGGLVGGISAGLISGGGLENAIGVIKAIADPQVIIGLGAIAGLMFALSKIKTSCLSTAKDVAKLGIDIGAVSVIVTAFAALGAIDGAAVFLQNGVELLQMVCSPEVITSIGLVAGLLAALALISKISSNVGTIAKSVANLGIVFGAITALVAALGAIGEIKGSLEFLTKGVAILKLLTDPKLIVNLGLLSGLMLVLGFLGPLAGPALVGAAALMGVVGIIGACIAAFGALAQIPGLTWLVNEGGELLGAIGTAIGKFFGGVVGGIAENVTSSLPSMATHFSEFMTNLKPFLDGINNVTPEMATSAKTLAETMLILTGANLIDKLASFILPFSSGTIQMSTFKETLTSFAGGVAEFGRIISESGVEPSVIKNGAESVKALMECINAMPKTGGLWQLLAGVESPEEMGKQLGALGSGVAAFAKSIAGVNNLDVVSAGAKAAKTLVTAISEMPRTGGLWQEIIGEVDPNMGPKLASLGAGIKGFAMAIGSEFNGEAVSAGANAALTLTKVLEQMPNAETWWSKLWSGRDMSGETIKTKFADLGAGISAFATNVGTISPDVVTSGANACLTLVKAINKMPSEGGIWTLDVATLKTKLSGLGEAIVKFVSSTSEISESDITAASSKINNLNKSLNSFSVDGIDTVIDAFNNAGTKIAKAVKSALKAGVDAVQSYTSKFKDAGKKLSKNLIDGLESNKSKVKKSLKTMVNDALKEIKTDSMYDKFYDAGAYLVEGFIEGIDDLIDDAVDKAVEMTNSVVKGIEDAAVIESPSKRTRKDGGYIAQGLILGLQEYSKSIYKAGYEVGDDATAGLNKACVKLASFVDGGMDTQPTIRPVLDLSEVERGANKVNNMFGMSPSLDLMTNIGSVSSMMNKRQNGASNDDVVSAITGLGNSLDNASGDTYIINGVTYDNGSQVQAAIETIINAILVGGRK